ncbi:hypothetical protein [Capnocytophaga canimorsus]|uniref:hypothetical protein n=1 Tax=Capnocytophaga canimorsus TaxID=28188 RepID=UPI001AD59C8B|nr:hypothetical protein [Capnocytophaga canimorsus]GIM59614.1 hypothetical protein CAPN007_18230 [Capnocytophaga canimorsus]
MKILITLIFCACVSFVKAQINSNSLFFVINNDNPNFYEKVIGRNITQKTYGINCPNSPFWSVSFMYFSKDFFDYPARFVLLMPQTMFKEFEKKNSVIYVKQEEEKWLKMQFDEFSSQVLERSPHYEDRFYNYYDKEYQTEKRYNIFIIKEEDLEEDYIPCYEVQLFIRPTTLE